MSYVLLVSLSHPSYCPHFITPRVGHHVWQDWACGVSRRGQKRRHMHPLMGATRLLPRTRQALHRYYDGTSWPSRTAGVKPANVCIPHVQTRGRWWMGLTSAGRKLRMHARPASVSHCRTSVASRYTCLALLLAHSVRHNVVHSNFFSKKREWLLQFKNSKSLCSHPSHHRT